MHLSLALWVVLQTKKSGYEVRGPNSSIDTGIILDKTSQVARHTPPSPHLLKIRKNKLHWAMNPQSCTTVGHTINTIHKDGDWVFGDVRRSVPHSNQSHCCMELKGHDLLADWSEWEKFPTLCPQLCELYCVACIRANASDTKCRKPTTYCLSVAFYH